MGNYQKEPRIDDYINQLPVWQQAICRSVRKVVHAADSAVLETIKRTNRPYFVLDGNICAMQATKTHVNIFVYDPIAPDPSGLINQGQHNLTARSIQIYEGDTLDEHALQELFSVVIKNNKEGGWRKIQTGK